MNIKRSCDLFFETVPALFFTSVLLVEAGPILCILLGFLWCCVGGQSFFCRSWWSSLLGGTGLQECENVTYLLYAFAGFDGVHPYIIQPTSII